MPRLCPGKSIVCLDHELGIQDDRLHLFPRSSFKERHLICADAIADWNSKTLLILFLIDTTVTCGNG